MKRSLIQLLPGFFAFFLILILPGEAAAAEPISLSNPAISNVIVAIARHWEHSLADGSYPAATTLAAAQAAEKPVGIGWEYAWGVNLSGQMHVSDATGDKTCENYVEQHNLICARYFSWLSHLSGTLTNRSERERFQKTNAVLGTFFGLDRLDYCGAMAAEMLDGARRAGGPSPEELQMARITADYISHRQSRRSDGTLWRSSVQGGTIWGDDLYMSCPFLVRWYQFTGDTNYLNDAARQVIQIAGYLQDTDGLWFHGYYESTHSVNGIKWGRANGWAMIAATEVLGALPAGHPARARILEILRRQIAGVEAAQAPDGMWHQVLDHPETWEETSCSAMFAYGIARAVNQGWIGATNLAVARKAFAAIARTQVSPTGVVSNICPGTTLNRRLAYYAHQLRPVTDDRHGPGTVMLAGAELLLARDAVAP